MELYKHVSRNVGLHYKDGRWLRILPEIFRITRGCSDWSGIYSALQRFAVGPWRCGRSHWACEKVCIYLYPVSDSWLRNDNCTGKCGKMWCGCTDCSAGNTGQKDGISADTGEFWAFAEAWCENI